jgi:hypothetical protein
VGFAFNKNAPASFGPAKRESAHSKTERKKKLTVSKVIDYLRLALPSIFQLCLSWWFREGITFASGLVQHPDRQIVMGAMISVSYVSMILQMVRLVVIVVVVVIIVVVVLIVVIVIFGVVVVIVIIIVVIVVVTFVVIIIVVIVVVVVIVITIVPHHDCFSTTIISHHGPFSTTIPSLASLKFTIAWSSTLKPNARYGWASSLLAAFKQGATLEEQGRLPTLRNLRRPKTVQFHTV